MCCVFFSEIFFIYFASGCQDNKKRIKMNFMYQSKIDLDTSYLISLMNLNTCLACGMLFQHSVEVGENVENIFRLSSVCSFSCAQHNFKSLEFRSLHLMFLLYKFVCLFVSIRAILETNNLLVACKVNQIRIQIHSIVKLNPVMS